MSRLQKLFLILIRIAVGWFLLYQGIHAILDPSWSLVPLITPAHTFTPFYTSLTSASVLPYLSYLIKGLFVFSGALLVIGIFVRIGALIGAALMLFFYFPLLSFPYIGNYYIVDEHMVIALLLIYLYAARAGELFGLGTLFKFSRY